MRIQDSAEPITRPAAVGDAEEGRFEDDHRAQLAGGEAADAPQRELAGALQDQSGERVDDAQHRHDDRHAEQGVRAPERLIEDLHHLGLHLGVGHYERVVGSGRLYARSARDPHSTVTPRNARHISSVVASPHDTD